MVTHKRAPTVLAFVICFDQLLKKAHSMFFEASKRRPSGTVLVTRINIYLFSTPTS